MANLASTTQREQQYYQMRLMSANSEITPQNSYAGCLEYRGFCLLYLVTLLILISFVVVVALDMLVMVVYILNDYYYCYYCCYHYTESSYNSIAPANTDMVKCLLSETFLEKVAHLNHG